MLRIKLIFFALTIKISNNYTAHIKCHECSKSFTHVYSLQVPDLDAGARGSTEPVAVGAEAQGIDDIPTVKRIKVLAFIEVP